MLIDVLKSKFPDLADLRVREIEVNKPNKKINCIISYPDYDKLDQSVRDGIISVAKSSIPRGFNGYISLVNDIFTSESLSKFIFSTIQTHFVALCVIPHQNFIVTAIDKKSFRLQINVSPYQAELLKECNFEREFLLLLNKFSCANVNIEINQTLNDTDISVLIDKNQKMLEKVYSLNQVRPPRKYVAEGLIKFIGKEIDSDAICIAEIREPKKSVTVYGKIIDKISINPSKTDPTLRLCKFSLADESGSIPVIFFVRFKIADQEILEKLGDDKDKAKKKLERNKNYNEDLAKKLDTLFDETSAVVRGKVVFNDYSNRYEIHGFDLSKCRLVEKTFKVEKAPVPENYSILTPTKMEVLKQLSFVSAQNDKIDYFKKDTVVCFADLTGKNIYVDKIVGISMIKFKNGVVSEKIEALLNPEMKISNQLAEDLGIEISKINSLPTIFEIIADLNKFCFGCNLVGVELVDTLANLNHYGKQFGYIFDNDTQSLTQVFEDLFSKMSRPLKPKNYTLLEVSKSLLNTTDTSAKSCIEKCQLAASCIEKAISLTKSNSF